jgi:hypothetical protein
MNWVFCLILWIYRHLLWVYPKAHRREFGHQQYLTFRDQLQESGQRKQWFRAMRVIASAPFDLVRSAGGIRADSSVNTPIDVDRALRSSSRLRRNLLLSSTLTPIVGLPILFLDSLNIYLLLVTNIMVTIGTVVEIDMLRTLRKYRVEPQAPGGSDSEN